ncbi:hypothetical protein PGTUg99_015074 [Puccinia graminis f. sp. tritici]|uniref:Uncharacterized protein n=1 Tax=Puccinia graminis f. sp. tritici TaxID=56615 RepID=A0A5B0RWT6_PUCGR|nr:hypothetical protein PGTUg99_037231 [Puccinia graminis f. sp. tritici]KAA1128964.1 hypothetical protein PGTUg99_015074 [Puccinia graminis f. sp. tritici]
MHRLHFQTAVLHIPSLTLPSIPPDLDPVPLPLLSDSRFSSPITPDLHIVHPNLPALHERDVQDINSMSLLKLAADRLEPVIIL